MKLELHLDWPPVLVVYTGQFNLLKAQMPRGEGGLGCFIKPLGILDEIIRMKEPSARWVLVLNHHRNGLERSKQWIQARDPSVRSLPKGSQALAPQQQESR